MKKRNTINTKRPPRIYTLTPNPALDLGGTVDDLVPNEKNYILGETRFAGGNGINVARLLTRSSVPVLALGFLGGSIGEEIQDLLDADRVLHRFIKITGNTRISITVSNKRSHEQTRLSFPGPKIKRNEITALHTQISKLSRGSWLVIGGSLPPGFKTTDLNHLIKIAKAKEIRVIVDIPGEPLRKVDQNGLILIKPNLNEFCELTQKKMTSIVDIAKEAKKLAQKINFVCVSSVEGGALLVTRNSSWFGIPPAIRVRSTVGAGDSMVAGMIAELWENENSASPLDEDALCNRLLRRGLASAAATLSTPGTELGSFKEIHLLEKEVKITNCPLSLLMNQANP